MSEPITEDDLRAAIMDELQASLPKPLGPDEWTIKTWIQRYGGTRSMAEHAMRELIEAGKVEQIPEKRNHDGKSAWAYRKTVVK